MKYIVDIHGEIEGDYEIIGKYDDKPTGKWIEHEPFERNNCNKCIECSVCKVWLGNDCYSKTNFCPMCGSRMVKEQQGENTDAKENN